MGRRLATRLELEALRHLDMRRTTGDARRRGDRLQALAGAQRRRPGILFRLADGIGQGFLRQRFDLLAEPLAHRGQQGWQRVLGDRRLGAELQRLAASRRGRAACSGSSPRRGPPRCRPGVPGSRRRSPWPAAPAPAPGGHAGHAGWPGPLARWASPAAARHRAPRVRCGCWWRAPVRRHALPATGRTGVRAAPGALRPGWPGRTAR